MKRQFILTLMLLFMGLQDLAQSAISRAHLDGSGVERLFSTTGPTVYAQGIAFDELERQIYWREGLGPVGTGNISRANIDRWFR